MPGYLAKPPSRIVPKSWRPAKVFSRPASQVEFRSWQAALRLQPPDPVERVVLADEFWESLADQPECLLLTEAQAAEFDRRLETYRKNSGAGVP